MHTNKKALKKIKNKNIKFNVLFALSLFTACYAQSVYATTVYGDSSTETIHGYVIGKNGYGNVPVEFINRYGQVIANTVTQSNGYYQVVIPNKKSPVLVAAKINGFGNYLFSIYEPSLYSIYVQPTVNITPFTTTLAYSLSGDHASLSRMSEHLYKNNGNLYNNLTVINKLLDVLFGTYYPIDSYSIVNSDIPMYYQEYGQYMAIPLYRDCLGYNYMVNISNGTMLKLKVLNGRITWYSKNVLPITNIGKYVLTGTPNEEKEIQYAINNTPSGGLVYFPSGVYKLDYYNGNQDSSSALNVKKPDITMVGSQNGEAILENGIYPNYENNIYPYKHILSSSSQANNFTLFNIGFNGNEKKLFEYNSQKYSGYLIKSNETNGFTAQFVSLFDGVNGGYKLTGFPYIINSETYKNNGTGIHLLNVNGAVIENNVVDNNKGAGIWINGDSINIEMNKNDVINNHPNYKDETNNENNGYNFPNNVKNTACYNDLSNQSSYTQVPAGGISPIVAPIGHFVATPHPVTARTHSSSKPYSYNSDPLTGLLGLLSMDAAGEAVEEMIKVGKSLNTGQIQQMKEEERLRNQQLQENTLDQKKLMTAEAKENYLYDTSPISQLPAMCEQGKAAAANLQAITSANVQGNGFNPAIGSEGTTGVFKSKSNAPSQMSKISSLASLTNADTNANALFDSKYSGESDTVMKTLLNPISSQPLNSAQADTPAGKVWEAEHNKSEVGLSMADSSMGFVAGLHQISVPGSAVSAVASAADVKKSSKTSSNRAAKKTPSIVKIATHAPKSTSTPSSSNNNASGDWQAAVPTYKTQIAQVAAEEDISPAIIAATIEHEDTSEQLSAMPCNDPKSWKDQDGYNSMFCYAQDSSAKSLGQMIDSTAISYGASYGLTNPMVVYGQHPNIELKAMAAGLKGLLGECNGEVACAFGAWNKGDVTSWMLKPLSTWPDNSTKQYAEVSMRFYTGQKQVNVNGYNGGGGSSSNTSAASTAGLLRLVSLGSYANPSFYKKLAKTNETGAWRVLLYLKATSMQVSNQNRQLMERLSAIMATRVSLAEKNDINNENNLRGNAMSQSNGSQ